MSLATSMKDLIEDIQVSTRDRHAFVKDLIEDTQASTKDRQAFVKDISKDVKELLARFDKELEGMRKDLKHFLANSEKARKEDFVVMMEDISKWQKDVRRGAMELVKEYAADHKKAHEYWMTFSGHRKLGRPEKEESE